jgi:hydrogenase expression/formation protein HypC
MCLAVPGRIKKIEGRLAEVDFSGVTREAALDLVPDAKAGDYILVHAGYAIQKMDEKEAQETLRLLMEVYGEELEEPNPFP